MKTKKPELDVDFIGGQDPLMVEEEKALSDFFKQHKAPAKKTLDIKKISIKISSKTL